MKNGSNFPDPVGEVRCCRTVEVVLNGSEANISSSRDLVCCDKDVNDDEEEAAAPCFGAKNELSEHPGPQP